MSMQLSDKKQEILDIRVKIAQIKKEQQKVKPASDAWEILQAHIIRLSAKLNELLAQAHTDS